MTRVYFLKGVGVISEELLKPILERLAEMAVIQTDQIESILETFNTEEDYRITVSE